MMRNRLGPASYPSPTILPHFFPILPPRTLLMSQTFLARLCLPPYFFKTCSLAAAHLHSTQAALSKGPMTSVLSDPVPTSQTSFLLVSLWILQ